MRNLPYFCTPARSWARLALAATLGGLLLPGCQFSSETPEAAGKRVATAMCERYTRRHELDYALATQLAAEIKAGKITTKLQARDRFDELNAPIVAFSDPSRLDVINDSLARTIANAFLFKEDRLEAVRVMERHMEQCEVDLAAWKKTRVLTNVRKLRRALPGTIPPEAYESVDGVTPPPPPPLLRSQKSLPDSIDY